MCARYYPRRGGAIPPALAQGKNVFPMVPMRNKLQIAFGAGTAFTSANNDGEVVDLDLQFEDNEVMDLWGARLMITATDDPAQVPTNSTLDMSVALFEDPDKADTTDIASENVIENDSSLVYLAEHRLRVAGAEAAGYSISGLTYYETFMFPQPYTVARNVKWILQLNATVTANDFDSLDLIAELWGRRRNAAQDEFINIVYRQRF